MIALSWIFCYLMKVDLVICATLSVSRYPVCFRNIAELLMWENDAPNDLNTVRPLNLIQEEETHADLLSEVVPTSDNVRKELNDEGIVQ